MVYSEHFFVVLKSNGVFKNRNQNVHDDKFLIQFLTYIHKENIPLPNTLSPLPGNPYVGDTCRVVQASTPDSTRGTIFLTGSGNTLTCVP